MTCGREVAQVLARQRVGEPTGIEGIDVLKDGQKSCVARTVAGPFHAGRFGLHDHRQGALEEGRRA